MLRQTVSKVHGVQISGISLLKPKTVPKTTSGKIARKWCRTAYENKQLQEVYRLVTGGDGDGDDQTPSYGAGSGGGGGGSTVVSAPPAPPNDLDESQMLEKLKQVQSCIAQRSTNHATSKQSKTKYKTKYKTSCYL